MDLIYRRSLAFDTCAGEILQPLLILVVVFGIGGALFSALIWWKKGSARRFLVFFLGIGALVGALVSAVNVLSPVTASLAIAGTVSIQRCRGPLHESSTYELEALRVTSGMRDAGRQRPRRPWLYMRENATGKLVADFPLEAPEADLDALKGLYPEALAEVGVY